ncbi:parvulin-like peptidyl-prolyl isomerase [Prosthecobacter fusiformis]|uniref:Parvulin-like peptidyl-prolyl isomerase n=1 Tax=Prosthecobacter fusiformis TaxID=48464 RepID=A0A4R7S733_9BACT|nr:peptidylprolyl isomerase [Prosthecobacter fusiformis]TDU73027.1 parvulin-like peptidyl-prolyl isomerase [Prosthecobacter fusiformis]
MKSWLLPVLLMLLIAGGYHWRKELRQRLIGSVPAFSTTEVQEVSAGLIFRNGTETDAQLRAEKELKIKDSLRRYRLLDLDFHPDVSNDLASEMHSWRRQWEKDGEREQRLLGQGITDGEMESSVHEALLDHAWIETSIADEIQVSEAELKAAFEQQRPFLKIPPAYLTAHLFLSRHGANKKDRSQEMRVIQQRLLAGETWERLTLAHSEDARSKYQGGRLGWINQRRMPTEFMTAVQRLNVGETSGPIATPLGWHLIRLLDKRSERLPRLEEVRTELMASLVQQKRQAALERLRQKLQQATQP